MVNSTELGRRLMEAQFSQTLQELGEYLPSTPRIETPITPERLLNLIYANPSLCEVLVLARQLKDSNDNVRQRFAGLVWQELCFAYLSARQPEASRLLSPPQTLEVYQHLTGGQIMPSPFGLNGIRGISVPDGFVVDLSFKQPRIASWCEYTLSNNPDTFFRKHLAFSYAKRNFPGLFAADSNFLYAVPERSELPRRIKDLPPDACFFKLPMEAKTFGQCINRLL